jgi:hypothetical protein
MSTRGSVLAWLDVHTRSVKEYAAETGRSGPQAQEAFSESEPPFARHGHSENSSPPGPIKTISPKLKPALLSVAPRSVQELDLID